MRLTGCSRPAWGVLFLLVVASLVVADSLVPAAAVAQQTDAEAAAVRQYNLAVGLQNKKLYTQAAQKWAAFIPAFPTDTRLPHAYHNLGVCQLQDDKLAEAAASFRAVLTKYPTFASADSSQFFLGLVLYNVATASKKPEDWKAALAEFTIVPTKYPQSKHAPSASYYQGECAYSTGDLPGAVAAYQKMIATYPQSPLLPDVHYALGTTLQELAKEPEAIAIFQAFIQKFPQDLKVNEVKLRMALSVFKQEKYAEAEPLFAQLAAVPMFPLADFALLRQAQCQNLREQYAPAAALYLTLPQKFPMSTHKGAALLAAGKCFFNAAQFPQAQQAFTPVITEKLAEAPEAAYWLARTLIKLMKPAEAVAELDKAIAAYPMSDLLPLLTFARIDSIYEQPEKRKECVPLYVAFVAKYPDHESAPKAAYMAALTALQLGEHAVAQQHAAAFLANPKFAKHELVPDVLFVGGESFLLAAMPEPPKAEPLFRRVVTEFPMHKHVPQSQLRVGLCQLLQKQYDPAVTYLTQVLPNLKIPAQVAEAQLLIGRAHADALRPDPAVTAFRASVAALPTWERGDEVLLALGVSLQGQKKLPEAAAEFTKLTTAYPKSPYLDQAWYQLGEIAFEEKKYDPSAAHYKQVVTLFPKSELAPPAQYGIGWALFAKEDFTQAVPAFTQLITAYPESLIVPRGKYVRGLAYRRLMQFDPAIKDLTEYVASKPPEVDALEARYAIALCQIGLKQFEPAVATLTALLQAKPDYAEGDKVYYELAYAYTELKKDKEAADAFRLLSTKFPMSTKGAEGWFRVGEFHEKAMQWPEAAAAFASGLERTKDPELRERLQYKQGWVLYQNAKYAESAVVLAALLKEHPQGKLLHASEFLAGECQFRQDKFAEALPLYALVIAAKSPEQDKALYRSGTCANNVKNWPVGQQHFLALIQQFPKYELVSEARYGLGLALQMQQKLDEAKAVYEQVTKETNTETAARSRFMIGECAFAQKKFDEAIEHFVAAATGYPYPHWQAEANFELGRCFIETKRNDQAKETLTALVKDHPQHARAKDAASLLATLK